MPNLLYKEYKTGCYIGWSSSSDDYTPGDYCYGYGNRFVSYYADLKPNTTYTIKRIDSSSRFRIALTSQDVKSLNANSSSSLTTPFSWGYRADNSDPITFTTNDTAIHLVVYFTNESEYSVRVMLNEGDSIQPYETPTLHFPWFWVIGEDGYPTHPDFIPQPESYMAKPYPDSLWRIDTDNMGFPYNELPNNSLMFGAFANATHLTRVSIPRSCKKIGREAFRNTQLASVTIARDCEYYPTSFPDGCVVNFYPD